MQNNLPKITIAIPSFNSEKRISRCLRLIRENNYPQEKIEIIIADGGSTDRTLEIAKGYNCLILPNHRRLPEPGKAVGIENASGELICFLDDDNFVDDKNFFLKMVKPFEDKEIIASEPWEYTYKKDLKPLERYWAIMGLNDPTMYFIGCYDRINKIKNKWTSLKIKQEDKGSYLKIKLNPKNLPTIGANGFIVKTEVIRDIDYNNLLDMDKMADIVKHGHNIFAKVKCGITHTFCSDLNGYWKKVTRKANSFYGEIGYSGQSTKEKSKRLYKYPHLYIGLSKFTLSTLLVLPLVYQALVLFFKTKDLASFLHIPVCGITLIGYGRSCLRLLRS